jgi:glycosyltransferase involved in cell wall biosynthesis
MSCGELTESECIEATQHESARFLWNEVRNIHPASSALNTMIRECKTDYLIPLDADMILYPGFMDRVEKAIEEEKGMSCPWHSILFPLWDTLTQEKIMALKVFKTYVVRATPYKDDPCPDIQHYQDLKQAGYYAVSRMAEDPIGKHVVRGGFFCYAKYRDLYMVTRTHPNVILESHFKGGNDLITRANCHFKFFWDRYKETGNDDYLYCIAGMVEGLISPLNYKSKNLGNREMKVPISDATKLFYEWAGRKKKVLL